jgi:hypothetical protein
MDVSSKYAHSFSELSLTCCPVVTDCPKSAICIVFETATVCLLSASNAVYLHFQAEVKKLQSLSGQDGRPPSDLQPLNLDVP